MLQVSEVSKPATSTKKLIFKARSQKYHSAFLDRHQITPNIVTDVKTPFPILISIALYTASAVIAQVSNTETAGSSPADPDTTAAPTVLTKPIAPSMETGIVGQIADGTTSVPAPKPEPINFKVKSTITRRVNVVEASELSDLPPVKGTITMKDQLVEDPGLPDPPLPPPLPALPVEDPAVLARLAEMQEKYRGIQIAFVSATVYDHSRTYLRCYPSGEGRKEICGWSNLDFNHFCGFGMYQVKGEDGELREYALLMGIGDVDTQRTSEHLAKNGKKYHAPEAPVLPDLAAGGPTFILTDGDTTDKESIALFQGMHDLYRVEGLRMKAAYHARIKAHAERKAYLLANPPVPKDVTIQVWKRKSPSAAGLKNLEEGAKQ